MVPIVLRAAEEALKLVPVSLRTASYALGASHAQTVLRVTVPAALPAIITAVFLSVARIAGETAPLLLTAGTNNFWPDGLGDFTPTLPPYIYKYADGPVGELEPPGLVGRVRAHGAGAAAELRHPPGDRPARRPGQPGRLIGAVNELPRRALGHVPPAVRRPAALVQMLHPGRARPVGALAPGAMASPARPVMSASAVALLAGLVFSAGLAAVARGSASPGRCAS